MQQDKKQLPGADKHSDKQVDKHVDKPKENSDFYLENGYMVFTAQFLKNRGYCCSNGCRHCPYKK